MLAHRDVKNREKPAPVGFRPWVYVLTVLVMMLIVAALIGPVFQMTRGEAVQQRDWIRLIVTEALVVAAGIVGWIQLKRLLRRRADRG